MFCGSEGLEPKLMCTDGTTTKQTVVHEVNEILLY